MPPGKVRNETEARVGFWKGRLLVKQFRSDSADAPLRKSLTLIDSASSPYTFHRITTVLHQIDINNGTHFNRVLADYDYYASIDDKPMQAATAIMIGNVLHDTGQHGRALYYLSRADSLHKMIGFTKNVRKNQMNTANHLAKLGRIEE